MLRFLFRFCLWMCGWKPAGNKPRDIKKFLVVLAPHTSNWDFPIGVCARPLIGLENTKYLGKKELFGPPFGFIFKWLGGIPVDRSKSSNLVDQIAERFEKEEELGIVIAPEGTRSYRKEWKTGFYHIAIKANLPILLGFMDYHKKEVGIGKVVNLTGDMDADMAGIKEFYKTKIPKHPEKSSLEHEIPGD